jgi:hypothetical protein
MYHSGIPIDREAVNKIILAGFNQQLEITSLA